MAQVPVTGRFHRLRPTTGKRIEIDIDGETVTASSEDTVLVAVLSARRIVRRSEFGGGGRAGMCLMGACQDCWMWTADGRRLRACTTRIAPGMSLRTDPPGDHLWPGRS